MLKRTFVATVAVKLAFLAILAGVFASAAQAQDKLKVAISQRGFWDSSFLEFALLEGIVVESSEATQQFAGKC